MEKTMDNDMENGFYRGYKEKMLKYPDYNNLFSAQAGIRYILPL